MGFPTFHYTDWLMGILVIAYYNLFITEYFSNIIPNRVLVTAHVGSPLFPLFHCLCFGCFSLIQSRSRGALEIAHLPSQRSMPPRLE